MSGTGNVAMFTLSASSSQSAEVVANRSTRPTAVAPSATTMTSGLAGLANSPSPVGSSPDGKVGARLGRLG